MNHLSRCFVTAFAAFLGLSVGWVEAQEKRPWIHIQVRETGEDASKVDIHLPMSLLEVVVDVAPERVVSKARLHLEHHGLSVADLRRLWAELERTGDGDLVTVEEEDENVHILRKGDHVVVDVDEKGGETTHLEIPVSVVDVLLSGEGEELDLKGAVARLTDHRGELLRVDGSKEQVHLWIDER